MRADFFFSVELTPSNSTLSTFPACLDKSMIELLLYSFFSIYSFSSVLAPVLIVMELFLWKKNIANLYTLVHLLSVSTNAKSEIDEANLVHSGAGLVVSSSQSGAGAGVTNLRLSSGFVSKTLQCFASA